MSKRRSTQSTQPLRFISTTRKIIVIILIGILLSLASTYGLYNFYTNILVQRVSSFALAVDTADITQLENLELKDEQVPYTKVKTKLNALKHVYPDVRFVYLMDRTSKGDVIFLADSESIGSPDYSARNEPYPDATDRLKAIFDTKKAFVEGPVNDDYGTWYSALAPVYNSEGHIAALIGMDVPITSYAGTILSIGVSPLVLALVISTATYFYDNGRRRRLEALRFQIELASIASYELQAPIKGIRRGQERLLKSSLDESQQKLLKTMQSGTEQLEHSVENILQLSSLQADESSQEMVTLNLAEIVQEVAGSQALNAQERQIQLILTASWPEAITVKADAVRLRRVFNNLIASEIKNTKEGGEIRFSYELKDGYHLISLTNTTLSLSREELNPLAGNTQRTSKLAGRGNVSGMELFIAKTTIEQFQGRLWIESAKDSSAVVVWIQLPATTIESA